MNGNELKKLERKSQYDPLWRKWRQGYAPKFRLKFWQRLQLSLSRKILTAFARRDPNDATLQSTLGVLDRLESMDEAGKGNKNAANSLQQEAIIKCRKSVDLAPDDAHARLMYGFALEADGQSAAASEQFKEGLRLDPANTHGHTMLSASLQKQGKLTEALEEARASLALAPSASHHLRLGYLLNISGDRAGARVEWEKVLEMDQGYLATSARLYLRENP
ncbi:MAG: tetratricopeptide repeat protein [Armatimonadota bacterium]|nr:tetratricopeptide repeat protein [Armatimonadota bacterium]